MGSVGGRNPTQAGTAGRLVETISGLICKSDVCGGQAREHKILAVSGETIGLMCRTCKARMVPEKDDIFMVTAADRYSMDHKLVGLFRQPVNAEVARLGEVAADDKEYIVTIQMVKTDKVLEGVFT